MTGHKCLFVVVVVVVVVFYIHIMHHQVSLSDTWKSDSQQQRVYIIASKDVTVLLVTRVCLLHNHQLWVGSRHQLTHD